MRRGASETSAQVTEESDPVGPEILVLTVGVGARCGLLGRVEAGEDGVVLDSARNVRYTAVGVH